MILAQAAVGFTAIIIIGGLAAAIYDIGAAWEWWP